MRARVRWKAWGLVLIGMGILVWMTGYLGNTYIRMITEAKTNVSQSATESTSAPEAQVTLAELNYWTCQVGVFKAEENAILEKSHLEQLGWETQIVSQSPWTVTIGFAHEQEELNELREGLKEGGVVNVAKHFVVPGQSYKITGSGAEQTAQILLTVHSFLETTPDQRGDTLSLLENAMTTSWPKKLEDLQQATAYVLKAEQTLDTNSKRLATLRLLDKYQNTLNELKK
ncbi:SPOR domain-containing protein [Desulfitobacterium metallireducens]|uniref:SPOR domain-containing protein n=1 Tax=Desulfitobacterium metallireducens DSM 15288 TaxID=871968 RepID=W0EFF7_9FIRM|nr:hypothetical protein [Desulfitobacterium metallireducens]AHF07934.1 hypothetical protein DESME_13535 [Desulfitobacterium metallireducens DSM 15288]